jgi:transposase
VKQDSADLRERLLRAIDDGPGHADAAWLFGVGTTAIERWRRRRRETGTLAQSTTRCREPHDRRWKDADRS